MSYSTDDRSLRSTGRASVDSMKKKSVPLGQRTPAENQRNAPLGQQRKRSENQRNAPLGQQRKRSGNQRNAPLEQQRKRSENQRNAPRELSMTLA